MAKRGSARRRDSLPPALARTPVPPAVLGVLRRLDRAGHRSWIVGGAVRDLLLGHDEARADWDVATPATPGEVMRLFRRTVPTGVEHGTVTVLVRGWLKKVEVTTFRGEGSYHDGRRPSSVTFLDDVDGDLARRDFTVNALAWDPVGGAFRDPFGGAADLRRRWIRAVGDPAARFGEDGLRPLRAARLAAQLGFAVEPATRAAVRGALPVVARVSVERVCDELTKLLSAAQPKRGLAILEETGLLEVVLPELAALPAARRAHALAVASAAAGPVAVRLAALLHAGAPGEPAAGSARRARATLARLRFPGATGADVEALVREAGCLLEKAGAGEPSSDAGIRQLLSRLGRERAGAFLSLRAAEARDAGPAQARAAAALARRVRAVLAARPALSAAELRTDGARVMDLLGLPPGPEVGAALRHLLERVLEEPRLNTPRGLEGALREWQASRSV